ncbi:uncharacterized protein MONOS_8921 [Monocercomonoides exilis]|uniref:uncharacterized protein n=1 Tax=Monocercomonoides exilis TaxID=2049356 RepID=UPI003559630F|nr:hypothetical protein MONOS_8921 [Monocercomonoides exilis]|eukprot:MONOS_8921.1-p1 / transcript=MONOS_8921.1 / gene=MONOS_8921 / organism=Monocercomonoides_exilis_PA203 / gene_product=unspecified product / transcript_product=unspecified product / location=Mono_scaffold00351:16226-18966(-) / protein_length=802 / sequence_SO=supercontig / SO=protein_coding / is_pseudo=false
MFANEYSANCQISVVTDFETKNTYNRDQSLHGDEDNLKYQVHKKIEEDSCITLPSGSKEQTFGFFPSKIKLASTSNDSSSYWSSRRQMFEQSMLSNHSSYPFVLQLGNTNERSISREYQKNVDETAKDRYFFQTKTRRQTWKGIDESELGKISTSPDDTQSCCSEVRELQQSSYSNIPLQPIYTNIRNSKTLDRPSSPKRIECLRREAIAEECTDNFGIEKVMIAGTDTPQASIKFQSKYKLDKMHQDVEQRKAQLKFESNQKTENSTEMENVISPTHIQKNPFSINEKKRDMLLKYTQEQLNSTEKYISDAILQLSQNRKSKETQNDVISKLGKMAKDANEVTGFNDYSHASLNVGKRPQGTNCDSQSLDMSSALSSMSHIGDDCEAILSFPMINEVEDRTERDWGSNQAQNGKLEKKIRNEMTEKWERKAIERRIRLEEFTQSDSNERKGDEMKGKEGREGGEEEEEEEEGGGGGEEEEEMGEENRKAEERARKRQIQEVKEEIAEAKRHFRVFGVWVRNSAAIDAVEEEMWEEAEKKILLKEKRREEADIDSTAESETLEELKQRLEELRGMEDCADRDSDEALRVKIERKEKLLAMQEKQLKTSNVFRFLETLQKEEEKTAKKEMRKSSRLKKINCFEQISEQKNEYKEEEEDFDDERDEGDWMKKETRKNIYQQKYTNNSKGEDVNLYFDGIGACSSSITAVDVLQLQENEHMHNRIEYVNVPSYHGTIPALPHFLTPSVQQQLSTQLFRFQTNSNSINSLIASHCSSSLSRSSFSMKQSFLGEVKKGAFNLHTRQ